MDTTVANIRTIQTELDRLRARRQYLSRAATLLKNDQLVDVTTDETTLRYAVHSLNNLISANDVFLERTDQQLQDAVSMYETINEMKDQSEKSQIMSSFDEELQALICDIVDQRIALNDSILSTREILGHFLEDRGAV